MLQGLGPDSNETGKSFHYITIRSGSRSQVDRLAVRKETLFKVRGLLGKTHKELFQLPLKRDGKLFSARQVGGGGSPGLFPHRAKDRLERVTYEKN